MNKKSFCAIVTGILFAGTLSVMTTAIIYYHLPTSKVMGVVASVERPVDFHYSGNTVFVEYTFSTSSRHYRGQEKVSFRRGATLIRAREFAETLNVTREVKIEYRNHNPSLNWISGERQETEGWTEVVMIVFVVVPLPLFGFLFVMAFRSWYKEYSECREEPPRCPPSPVPFKVRLPDQNCSTVIYPHPEPPSLSSSTSSYSSDSETV